MCVRYDSQPNATEVADQRIRPSEASSTHSSSPSLWPLIIHADHLLYHHLHAYRTCITLSVPYGGRWLEPDRRRGKLRGAAGPVIVVTYQRGTRGREGAQLLLHAMDVTHSENYKWGRRIIRYSAGSEARSIVHPAISPSSMASSAIDERQDRWSCSVALISK